MRRGKLIALDGVDGAGKSVQCRRLAERLTAAGHDCVVLREPGGTPLGERLREALLEGSVRDALVEALLFMASRRHLVVERIQPEVEAGRIVLLDRSFVSTWVYQGVVGGVDLDYLVDLARRVHGAFWPDRVLLLELDAATARSRRVERASDAPSSTADAFEDRGAEYLERVRAAYGQLADRFPEWIQPIDARPSVASVTEECWQELLRLGVGAQP